MKIAIAILKVKLTTLTVWFIAATARPIHGDLFGDQEFFDCHSPVAIK